MGTVAVAQLQLFSQLIKTFSSPIFRQPTFKVKTPLRERRGGSPSVKRESADGVVDMCIVVSHRPRKNNCTLFNFAWPTYAVGQGSPQLPRLPSSLRFRVPAPLRLSKGSLLC